MNHRISYILIALLSAFLLILAVSSNSWYCESNLLSPVCRRYQKNVITAVLFLIAALCLLLVSIFLIFLIREGPEWTYLAALIISAFGAILSITAVCYYIGKSYPWSPIFASLGSGILISLFIAMVFGRSRE